MALTGLTDLVGLVLVNRYRLVAPIGVGASGRVYVATDVLLGRRVAVKILYPALAYDTGFLRRFRAEAQLAASLHHPNIMAVYDWGGDQVPFMVFELLPGGSLRGMLDEGVRLTPAQASDVGEHVTAALSYAHARGVVHRDIKPANLLFDEHGTARVADFGLARALAEASSTEPAGGLVGTARYAAPEQGTGATLDGRADLYALAVVLVEAVTGRVPEVGDTPIGTLAQRTQVSLRAPDELGALGPVIDRAGRSQPTERYADAETMGDALADAARRLPPPGPLTLLGLGGQLEDPDPTEQPRTVMLFEQDADATVAKPPPPGDAMARARAEPARRTGRYASWAVPIIVVALLLAVLVAAGVLFARSASARTVPAPQLVGLTQDDAAARATEGGLVVAIEHRGADDPAGRVISQSPAAGSWLHDGATVRLIVSRGPPPATIPDVAGKPQAEATLILIGAGFAVDTTHAYDQAVRAGIAIRTVPAAIEKQAPDTTITLIVSDGPAPVAGPDASETAPSTEPAPTPPQASGAAARAPSDPPPSAPPPSDPPPSAPAPSDPPATAPDPTAPDPSAPPRTSLP
jgi:beta-lactam-binding protein with PASTA domain